jgi:hypothetical protein
VVKTLPLTHAVSAVLVSKTALDAASTINVIFCGLSGVREGEGEGEGVYKINSK